VEEIRIESVSPPLDRPGVAERVAAIIRRADAMGLLRSLAGPVERLDLSILYRLLEPVRDEGIATSALQELASKSRPREALLTAVLDRLQTALLESPTPKHEWPRLTGVLGLELVARLVGTSAVSARRYASGERDTPPAVADRLHHLAMIVGDLAGAYNDLGMQLWFSRPRKLLGGKAPAELLNGEWRPDDEGPQHVFALAASLAGSPAT
jgi:hypothetical protein